MKIVVPPLTPMQKYKELIKSNGPYDALHNDTNNCTVLALSACFGVSYDEAYRKAMKAWNRKHAKGVRTNTLTRWFEDAIDNGYKLYNRTVESISNVNLYKTKDKTVVCKTRLGTFAKNNPQGTYYVLVRSHATVVKDGKIMDFTKPGSIVKRIWKVV